MVKQYKTVEYGRTGRYQDFAEAILVKVVPADEFDYYIDIKDDPDSEEEVMQLENWLMFKYSPDKYETITSIVRRCDRGGVWYLDLDTDFILRSTFITNNNTGSQFMRPIYQVVMVNSNLDMVDAKENGTAYKGRTGTQKRLDELNLPLEGTDIKYYMIGNAINGKYYGIPYDYKEEYNGHFFVDEVRVNPYNGAITVVKSKAGIYNPLMRQFFKFA
ncbi:hypothetical protein [uncultured Parabacteroides sp.]|uniref:hypothetical protein n=1 Tax=uncultured Parabacteroides sp. TaxID=512312 RepID=UPI00263B6071|nr:hypothetical protein [uncultured Parabacteroides sp.]